MLALLVAAAVLAAPVRAQELEQLKRHEARLLARRDELLQQVAREADGRFRSERRTVLAAGPLRLAYPAWATAAGDTQLARTLEAQVRRYGTAAGSLLADTLYVWVDETFPGRGSEVKYRIGELTGTQNVAVDSFGPGTWVAEIVAAALQDRAEQLIDPRLVLWTGRLDPRTTVATLRDPIVRDLVGSLSSRARHCLSGVPEECRLVLELDAGATPLLSAYDPADLPALFRRIGLDPRIPGRASCVGNRDGAACAELVRLGRAEPPHPLSIRARQSFFAYALAAGGEDAWLRLHRARGRPLAEQLAAAAGRPVDSLVVAWRHDLLEGRRTTASGLAPNFLLALAWGVVGILLFAWRYRWRRV